MCLPQSPSLLWACSCDSLRLHSWGPTADARAVLCSVTSPEVFWDLACVPEDLERGKENFRFCPSKAIPVGVGPCQNGVPSPPPLPKSFISQTGAREEALKVGLCFKVFYDVKIKCHSTQTCHPNKLDVCLHLPLLFNSTTCLELNRVSAYCIMGSDMLSYEMLSNGYIHL